MIFKEIHQIIPGRSLLKLFLGASVMIQIAVISYSHFTGYYTVEGFSHLATKLIGGISLTFVGTALVAYPDLLIIHALNRSLPWNERTLARLLLQLLATVCVGIAVSIFMTSLSHAINPYKEPLMEVFFNNALIFSVCNLIIMITLEAWTFFIERSRSKNEALRLEKEISEIRFEVLKNQINPHFMFNALNVLSGLIESNPQKAQSFIDEFSYIYRYVLDTIDQQLVTLSEELKFSRSYMFLQQIRYGAHLHFEIDLSADILSWYLPPLSLQVVLENAIKHNLVSSENPLMIALSTRDQSLIVTNNLQPKVSPYPTTGIGQHNLSKRYSMIGERVPDFRVSTSHYEAVLPLFDVANDEYSDH